MTKYKKASTKNGNTSPIFTVYDPPFHHHSYSLLDLANSVTIVNIFRLSHNIFKNSLPSACKWERNYCLFVFWVTEYSVCHDFVVNIYGIWADDSKAVDRFNVYRSTSRSISGQYSLKPSTVSVEKLLLSFLKKCQSIFEY